MGITQAVIPFGFEGAAHGLARALVDAARFGFTDIFVLAPTSRMAEAEAALAQAGTLPHGAQVALHAADPTAAGAAIAGATHLLAERFLLLDPDTVITANWLELLAHDAPAGVALVNGAPFGVAQVSGATLRHIPRHASLPDLFRALAAEGAHLWPVAAGQARPARPGEPARTLRPALFLDRDGTLNEDYGYVSDPARLVLLPGAVAAVKRANELGWYVFLVTNQSGVGRGYYAEKQVLACNSALQAMLRAKGAHIDDMRYAADHPQAVEPRYRVATGWRKPEPGMLIDLMAHWPVMREKSLMVGDRDSDVQAGEGAQVRGLLFDGEDLEVALGGALDVAPLCNI
ncbi:D-glycero-alpha-D-manno-heptose-1,7-bisphosphate 7-phosphatase [Xanthobacteraceae bacterium A53D]